MNEWDFDSCKAYVEIKVANGATKIAVDNDSDSQGMFLAFTALAKNIITNMKEKAPEYDIVDGLQKAVLAANDMDEYERNNMKSN